jgi:8-oxo-dGTP pyrophosphatase MutT (NUDIX family)
MMDGVIRKPIPQSLVDEAEITALAVRYGNPVRWSRALEISPKMLGEREKALKKRRGETVLAIPRPNRRVLLHTKTFYPSGTYRLLSGGIEIAESVEEAACREIREETGFSVRPSRFLGVVEYEFRNQAHAVPWVSYVFLTEETGEPPQVLDSEEGIADFREIAWTGLARVAEELERLPGEWNGWGRFRAVPHRLAGEFAV